MTIEVNELMNITSGNESIITTVRIHNEDGFSRIVELKGTTPVSITVPTLDNLTLSTTKQCNTGTIKVDPKE